MKGKIAKYLRKKAKEQTLLPEREYYKLLKKSYKVIKHAR